MSPPFYLVHTSVKDLVPTIQESVFDAGSTFALVSLISDFCQVNEFYPALACLHLFSSWSKQFVLNVCTIELSSSVMSMTRGVFCCCTTAVVLFIENQDVVLFPVV